MTDLQGDELNANDNGRPAGAKPTVAYLVNQYPKVSHTFIRREILALERQGFDIRRFAIRGWDADVVDPVDIDEGRRTRHVLKNGLLPLVKAVLVNAVKRPLPTFRALRAALAMSRKSIRPLPYHIVWFAHACQLRLWFEADGIDHLHAHFGTNSADVAHLVHLLDGPPYSFTVHGADEFDNVLAMSLPRKCGSAEFVVAISHYTKSQLMRQLPQADWQKLRLVHCGLEEAFFAPTFTPFPQQPVLLCIGRYCAEKSQLTLLDALAALARPEVRLVLAGDGDFRPLIERRIAELGLSRQVTLTGWIGSDEVRKLITEATLVVQPSLMEGLPVVIMEAMAQGRPVISTYIAGIPELVQEGRTGWLVPAGDAPSLTEAMAAALDTPSDVREAMGRDGAVRVRERHHIDTEAAKLARLFTKGPTG
ncbi:glycosyltransferase family 4 protein [Tabrizicola sp. BL-A-41-H6]|uniref:glycosyltransferase family 4 protein n=1 Tax=Tabrizicola sp. BL-A-41-H6 TaxID=3421107 RepID=UPI003D66BCDE